MNKNDFIKAIESKPQSIRLIELISLFLGDCKMIWTDWIDGNDTDNLNSISKKFGFNYFIFKNLKINKWQILLSKKKSSINNFQKLYSEGKINPLITGFELGYPECCVNGFNEYERSGDKSLIKHIYDKSDKSERFPFYMNNICSPFSKIPPKIPGKAYFRKNIEKKFSEFEKLNKNIQGYFLNKILEPFIIWHPCSYQCKESMKRVRKIYEFFGYLLPKYAEVKKNFFSKPVFFVDDFRFALLNGISVLDKEKKKTIVVKYDSILKYPKTFISKKDIDFINKRKLFEIEDGRIKNEKDVKFVILPFF
ncbi:MAG TPA: hypothetical protein PK103_09745 [Elusimicrobiales bacterium]|nr:hypothetical protein [Elusimicrobiales bacterium]HOL63629.1 hypothetical protein [Elusimicrobiales bacterium]